MDITPEMAAEHLKRWKSSSSPLSVAVQCDGLSIFSQAIVKAVSKDLLFFAFSETGGLKVVLTRATRFQSFLPTEAAPSDVGGVHKACLVFLVIRLEDGTLCKICELSDQSNFPVVLFSGTENEGEVQAV